MRFPIVAPLETLGPIRRVGGEYTTAKRMNFAPVAIHMDRDKMQVPVVGRDGKIYRGATDTSEETEDMKTTSRPEISPTLVSLYVDGKPAYERKKPVPLIHMPHADLTRLVKVMRAQNPEYWRERETKEVTVEPSEPVEVAESEGEEASAESSKESVTSVTSTEGEASEPEEPTSSEPEPSSESSKEPTPSETEPSSESSKEPMPSELEPSKEPSGIEEAEVEVEI
ncbi:uncharacterized protein CDAR_240201 [Caerostris darwini]|uniref:Uncharacterized protein n=1 Tax=Caerostris darwini TaxID=1538125 RepID=A0AAV4V4H1_9ARAC|nr:uncharacterized protein CDAR_240201 [Caerostris darwini]